jgi:glycogen(starch) synthase
MTTTVLMSSHDRDGGAKNASRLGEHDLKVLIVGPYPPPFGGVSSHVQRATSALGRAGHTVAVLNHFGTQPAGTPVMGSLHRNPFHYFIKLRKARAGVVHYHYAGRLSLLLAAALARWPRDESRWLITLHNHSLERHLARRPSGPLIRWALGRFDQIVAVSPEIARFLKDHRVDTPTVVLPAYVPSHAPAPAAHQNLVSSAAREDWAPAAFFERPGETLVVSAYRVIRFGSGGDLYGLEAAAKTFAALGKDRAELRLAIFLSHPPRGRWAKRHLRLVLQNVGPELRERVGIWVGEQLLQAFRPNVIYLRPTQTDGDAVSVREALDRAVPVIASDCVARPAGVITVPYGDQNAWRERVASTLTALESKQAVVPASQSPSNDSCGAAEQEILELYGFTACEPSLL